MFFYILLISICCCSDSFNIGLLCGLKSMTFQNHSNSIFYTTTLLVSIISVLLGIIIKISLPTNLSNILGIYIIIGLGISFLINNTISYKTKYKSFDLDNSNDIDAYEMFILGLVLSLNSLYIGISCTLLEFNILLFLLLYSSMQLIFLLFGFKLGKKDFLTDSNIPRFLLISSGIILIIIGCSLFP